MKKDISPKLARIILLFISLLPYLFFILMYTLVGPGVFTKDPLLVFLGIITFLSIPILIVFYVINVYRNNSVVKNQRILWTVLLIGGNFVVFPFYWYNHIWKNNKANPPKYDNNIATENSKTSVKTHTNTLTNLLLLLAGFLPIIFGVTSILIALYIDKNMWFYTFGILSYISLFLLILIYVVNVLKNPRVVQSERALWISVIILGNVITFPFYWYLNIWREPKNENPDLPHS